MSHNPPTIDYASQTKVPRTLTLDAIDGGVRVTFPVKSAWDWAGEILAPFAVGFMQLGAFLFSGTVIWMLTKHLNAVAANVVAGLRSSGTQLLETTGLWISISWGIAAFNGWRYLRWRNVPRVLIATRDGIVLTRPGWIRLTERRWAPAEIEGIRLKIYRFNLNCKKTAADLFVDRLTGGTLRFRLSTKDAQLPAEIAQRIAMTIGCPFKQN